MSSLPPYLHKRMAEALAAAFLKKTIIEKFFLSPLWFFDPEPKSRDYHQTEGDSWPTGHQFREQLEYLHKTLQLLMRPIGDDEDEVYSGVEALNDVLQMACQASIELFTTHVHMKFLLFPDIQPRHHHLSDCISPSIYFHGVRKPEDNSLDGKRVLFIETSGIYSTGVFLYEDDEKVELKAAVVLEDAWDEAEFQIVGGNIFALPK